MMLLAGVSLPCLMRLLAFGLSMRAHVEEGRLLRYEPLSLTLLFTGNHLVDFHLDMPPSGERGLPVPKANPVGRDEVLPGQGALGISFGDRRELVASQFGNPWRSYGFTMPEHPSGAEIYRVADGYVTVTVNDDEVTQIAGWGLFFQSPLGFKYGMDPATVKKALGRPEQEDAWRYYRSASTETPKMSLIAVVVGAFGGFTFVGAIGLIPWRRKHSISQLLVALLIGLSAYWLRLTPLLPEGFYPLRIGPVLGAVSWAFPWLGAASAAQVVLLRIRARPAARRWSPCLPAVVFATAAGVAGGLLGNLAVRLLLWIYHRVDPTQPYGVIPPHLVSMWISTVALGAITALVSLTMCRHQWNGDRAS